jgi:hypothetical protein
MTGRTHEARICVRVVRRERDAGRLIVAIPVATEFGAAARATNQIVRARAMHAKLMKSHKRGRRCVRTCLPVR